MKQDKAHHHGLESSSEELSFLVLARPPGFSPNLVDTVQTMLPTTSVEFGPFDKGVIEI